MKGLKKKTFCQELYAHSLHTIALSQCVLWLHGEPGVR